MFLFDIPFCISAYIILYLISDIKCLFRVLLFVVFYICIMTRYTGKTEAQKKADRKYESKFKKRILRIPFDKDELLVAHAKKNNESVSGLIIRLIDEELGR